MQIMGIRVLFDLQLLGAFGVFGGKQSQSHQVSILAAPWNND
jgi:hypothetical protein